MAGIQGYQRSSAPGHFYSPALQTPPAHPRSKRTLSSAPALQVCFFLLQRFRPVLCRGYQSSCVFLSQRLSTVTIKLPRETCYGKFVMRNLSQKTCYGKEETCHKKHVTGKKKPVTKNLLAEICDGRPKIYLRTPVMRARLRDV